MDVLPATHLAIGSEDSPPHGLGLPVLMGMQLQNPGQAVTMKPTALGDLTIDFPVLEQIFVPC